MVQRYDRTIRIEKASDNLPGRMSPSPAYMPRWIASRTSSSTSRIFHQTALHRSPKLATHQPPHPWRISPHCRGICQSLLKAWMVSLRQRAQHLLRPSFRPRTSKDHTSKYIDHRCTQPLIRGVVTFVRLIGYVFGRPYTRSLQQSGQT